MEKTKSVRDMTLGEAVASEGFYRTISGVLGSIARDRKRARYKARPGERLRADVFDRLEKSGYTRPETFVSCYLKLLDNEPVPLSSTERAYVRLLGDLCFHTWYSLELDRERKKEDGQYIDADNITTKEDTTWR